MLWLYKRHRTRQFTSSSISRFGSKLFSSDHQNLLKHVKICSAFSSSSTQFGQHGNCHDQLCNSSTTSDPREPDNSTALPLAGLTLNSSLQAIKIWGSKLKYIPHFPAHLNSLGIYWKCHDHLCSSSITSVILWLHWLHRTRQFNSLSICRFGRKLVSMGPQNLRKHVKIRSASCSFSTQFGHIEEVSEVSKVIKFVQVALEALLTN